MALKSDNMQISIPNKDKFEQIVQTLCSPLFNFAPIDWVTEDDISAFIENLTVVFPCGGESKRMAELNNSVHKTALHITNEDTLLTRMIKLYASYGVKKFVMLVGINSDSILESTNTACKDLDVQLHYSADPGKPVGRGGAILHAIESGLITPNEHILVHNADDQIVNYKQNFLRDICKAHIANNKKGAIATAIVAVGVPFPYTALSIEDSIVTCAASKPRLYIPAHTGITILQKEAQKYFPELFDYSGKKDFEDYLFPVLIKRNALGAHPIPGECWIPVNTPKEYKQLLTILNQNA